MSFFEFYGDDSYANPTQRGSSDYPFVIGGYVAPAKTWRVFERDWKKLLAGENLSDFHATDCDGGWKQFEGKKAAELQHLQSVFYSAINRYEIYGVVAGVPRTALEEYQSQLDRIVPREKRGSLVSSPYMFTLQLLFNATFARLKGHERPVTFVFDRQDEYEKLAQTVRAELARSSTYPNAARLGPLKYCSRREAVALQAADIVAYEAMRELRDGSRRWQREELDKNRPVHVEYFDSAMLAEFVATVSTQ